MAGDLTGMAAAAGTGIGGGIGVLAGFRFVRWAAEFVCARLDARAAILSVKELALEKRYDERLRHLEDELARTRRALMLLINHTARNNPTNPVLMRVAEILGPLDDKIVGPLDGTPPPPEPELEELLMRAKRTGEL